MKRPGQRLRLPDCRRAGFTLLELLLAISILTVVMAGTYLAFGVVTTAWKCGQAMSEGIHHGDFVLDQLVMGLRSAYYPTAKARGYGFMLEDNADGSFAQDKISWVKLGRALVGKSCPFADSPHRVEFTVEDTGRATAVAIRAWRAVGLPEDFDPTEEAPVSLSRQVTGFDCRCAMEIEDGEIAWEDEWVDDLTNMLPRYVEITVYLAPVDKGGEAIELRRIVELPTAHLSWKE